jgi:hypothetical protein
MTAPETGIPQGDPLNALPTVTFYTDTHEVQITDLPLDQSGSTTDLHIKLAPNVDIKDLPRRLGFIYDAMGPGEHDTRTVASATGYHVNNLFAVARRLGGILPEQLIGLERRDERMFLRLGAMAIKRAGASADQVAAFELRAAAIETAKSLRAKEAVLAADKEKINLTEYDHAVISFGGRSFYLLLDDPGMILAGRVIDTIAELREAHKSMRIRTGTLTTALWERMPVAERVLYTDNEVVAYGSKFPSKILGKSIEGLLENLTGKMGITRRGGRGDEYVLPRGGMELDFDRDPFPDSDSLKLTLIFPQASELVLKTMPAEDIARAIELADMAMRDPQRVRLNDEAAIALLDDVTSPYIKRALVIALRRSGTDMPVGIALHNLHRIVQHNMGYIKHSVAWGNRTIGGSLWRRTASQAGGALPADRTNWTLGQFEKDVRSWTFQTLRLAEANTTDAEQ